VRHSFSHRHYQWLVDVDRLPEHRGLLRLVTRIEASDHLDSGRLGGGIRGDLSRFLTRRGITLEPTDRVLMLAHARVLGHTFDPLSVFWCLAPDDTVRAVVFEVHNTYGERHAYLLDLNEDGRGRVDKELYVSPFNDVSGEYDVTVRLNPQRVHVAIALHRDGRRVMTAASSGSPLPASPRNIVRTVARHLLMTYRVSLLIRVHGVRLWLSRLPVVPRPFHDKEGVR